MADMPWDELISEAGDRFNVPPEGDYVAIIEEAESTVSKNSGNQMIALKLKISEGPHSSKRPKKTYMVKSAKAAGMFLGHAKAVGITADTLKKHNPTMSQIAAVIVGKRVSIEIKHEEYRGETQAVVNFAMKPPPGGAVEVTSFPPISETLGHLQDAGAAATATPNTGYTTDPGF